MYKDIKAIYNKVGVPIFTMASAHLMDIGWKTAKKITDENIEQIEGNGLMTREFCQDLVRVARDLANVCSPVEFVQFCQVEKLYDTRGFKTK